MFAHLENGAELNLVFKTRDRKGIYPIKKKAIVHVWGKKDIADVNSAGYVVFVRTSSDGTILYESGQHVIGDGLNIITAPDSEYTYLRFGLPGDIVKGATSFYIDAVMLKEDLSSVSVRSGSPMSASAIIANYPNPFLAGSSNSTNLVITLDRTAHVGIIVTDALGREVRHLEVGSLEAGKSRIPLTIEAPGFYAVRLVIDGISQQQIYKLTAR